MGNVIFTKKKGTVRFFHHRDHIKMPYINLFEQVFDEAIVISFNAEIVFMFTFFLDSVHFMFTSQICDIFFYFQMNLYHHAILYQCK